MYISTECRKDLLLHWNGVSLFLENKAISANSPDLYPYLFGTLRFEGYYKMVLCDLVTRGTEINLCWWHDFSITFKNIYPIVVTTMFWVSSWKNNLPHQQSSYLPHPEQRPFQMPQYHETHVLLGHHIFSHQFCVLRWINSRPSQSYSWLSRLLIKKFHRITPQAKPRPHRHLPSLVMFN